MKVVVYTASANDMRFQIPIQLMGNAAYKDGREVGKIEIHPGIMLKEK